MKRPRLAARSRAALAVLLALPLLCAVAWTAEKLIVIEKEAAIRKDKRTYGPRLASVKEGEEVTLVEREEPWLRVDYKGIQGWMSESAVTDDPDVVLSKDRAARGVRATEQSAAGRGFTPEVEKEYRKTNPNLDGAFKYLDQLEATKYSDDKILKFLEEGKLVDLTAGGDE